MNEINNTDTENNNRNKIVEAETGSTSIQSSHHASLKKLIIVLIIVIILLGSVIGVLIFGKNKTSFGAQPIKPIPVGKTIVVPDVTDGGKNNKEIGQANPDPSAPKYVDPINMEEYRHIDTNGNVTIEAPLDGKCATGPDGAILPPDNYLHICYYEKNGAVYYTSHAMIGPRTGALENIQYLKIGTNVIVDGQKYTVATVEVFDKNHLPDYLFKPGEIGLITCHIDASVKTFKDFTKTDVVRLKKV